MSILRWRKGRQRPLVLLLILSLLLAYCIPLTAFASASSDIETGYKSELNPAGDEVTVTVTVKGSEQKVNNEKDIILVIDRSASMGDPAWNCGPSRMDKTKEAAKLFVSQVLKEEGTKNKVGIVTFHATARKEVEFTNDIGALNRIIENISPENESLCGDAGGTNLQAGIYTAGLMMRNGHDTTVIVLSDGRPNYGFAPKGDPKSPVNPGALQLYHRDDNLHEFIGQWDTFNYAKVIEENGDKTVFGALDYVNGTDYTKLRYGVFCPNSTKCKLTGQFILAGQGNHRHFDKYVDASGKIQSTSVDLRTLVAPCSVCGAAANTIANTGMDIHGTAASFAATESDLRFLGKADVYCVGLGITDKSGDSKAVKLEKQKARLALDGVLQGQGICVNTEEKQLNSVLENLAGKIVTAGTNGIVTDVLNSSFAQFIDFDRADAVTIVSCDPQNSATYSAATKTVTWAVGDLTKAEKKLVYKVKLKSQVPPGSYFVSQSARLDYTNTAGKPAVAAIDLAAVCIGSGTIVKRGIVVDDSGSPLNFDGTSVVSGAVPPTLFETTMNGLTINSRMDVVAGDFAESNRYIPVNPADGMYRDILITPGQQIKEFQYAIKAPITARYVTADGTVVRERQLNPGKFGFTERVIAEPIIWNSGDRNAYFVVGNSMKAQKLNSLTQNVFEFAVEERVIMSGYSVSYIRIGDGQSIAKTSDNQGSGSQLYFVGLPYTVNVTLDQGAYTGADGVKYVLRNASHPYVVSGDAIVINDEIQAAGSRIKLYFEAEAEYEAQYLGYTDNQLQPIADSTTGTGIYTGTATLDSQDLLPKDGIYYQLQGENQVELSLTALRGNLYRFLFAPQYEAPTYCFKYVRNSDGQVLGMSATATVITEKKQETVTSYEDIQQEVTLTDADGITTTSTAVTGQREILSQLERNYKGGDSYTVTVNTPTVIDNGITYELAEDESKMVTLTNETNNLTVVEFRYDAPALYQIVYRAGNEELGREAQQVGVIGGNVTVQVPQEKETIGGFALNDDREKTVKLSNNTNEIIFQYSAREDIGYQIQHVIHGGQQDGMILKTVTGAGIQGSAVGLEPEQFAGYSPMPENPQQGTPEYGKDNVFVLYYEPVTVAYSVRYVDTAGRDIATATTKAGLYATRTTEAAPYIQGYTALTAANEKANITLGLNPEENQITFSYQPVPTPPITGPTGGGGGGRTQTPQAAVIPDEATPLADGQTVVTEPEPAQIEEEEVPLAQLPKTGGAGIAGFVILGTALTALGVGIRRKEE